MARRLAPLLIIAALVAAAPAWAQEPTPTLPEGSAIAGVTVGGLTRSDARAELRRRLVARYGRAITIRVLHRRYRYGTERLGQRIRYARMLDDAFAMAAAREPVTVPLRRSMGRARVSAAVARVSRPVFRRPRSARAIFGIRHIGRVRAHWGRRVQTRRLRRALVHELWRPTRRRTVVARVEHLRPAVTGSQLRRRAGTYISVDRGRRLVRLFKHLRRVRTFRVAVGAAGYDTPAGMHHVLYKERNPTWHVPNRAWAGSLAGQTIPPGDPRNPLKARFIALGGGVGFHGTADLASIGQAASHGCIRMRVGDVIALYNRTPVGTPVRIR
jgi:hypothetical protein